MLYDQETENVAAGACSAVLLLQGIVLPERLPAIAFCQWKWQHQGSGLAERLKHDGNCSLLLPLPG